MDQERIVLLGILLIALFVRVPYVFQESVWNDETVYMWLGDKIRQSPSFLFTEKVAYHSYGYLIDISTAVLSLFMTSFAASRIATLAFSLAGIGLAYLLGKGLTNQWGGAVAALLVALNPQHVFFSVRSLTDVYLATTLSLFAYAATKFDKTKKSGILLGSSVVLAMMSRVTGVLVLPLGILVLAKQWYKKRKIDAGLKYGAGIIGGFFAVLLAANFLFFGNPFQFGGASLAGGIFTGSRLYYFEAAGLLYSLPVFYLALAGLYFAIDDQRVWPTAAAFLTYFLWFSIMAGEKVPRYVLQTIPLVAVLAVFCIYSVMKKFKLDERLLAAAAVLVLFSFPQIAPLVQGKTYSYTGLQELGEKMAELSSIQEFSTIYAQSTRQIRAFSGIDYYGEGGNIRGLPQDVNELLNQTNIALEIDVWEYSAPDWIYPISQEKINFLLANNFTVAHTVIRDYPTDSGLQSAIVGVLLIR